MQQGADNLVKVLLRAYPEGIKERDNVSNRTPLECKKQSYCRFPHPLPHNVRLSSPVAQAGYLPFDLALQRGCLAPLLALLEPGSKAWLVESPFQPLVSAEEIKVFESLSHLLDPNPRRLKRIISVYALASQVSKLMPLSENSLQAPYAIRIPHLRACEST